MHAVALGWECSSTDPLHLSRGALGARGLPNEGRRSSMISGCRCCFTAAHEAVLVYLAAWVIAIVQPRPAPNTILASLLAVRCAVAGRQQLGHHAAAAEQRSQGSRQSLLRRSF